MREDQLRTLRHMLGIDGAMEDNPKPYRNYYCANPGDPEMAELERAGMVTRYCSDNTYDWYTCTKAGVAAAIHSHQVRMRRRPTKKQARYRKYLRLKDVLPDLTFRDFLVNPEYWRSQ